MEPVFTLTTAVGPPGSRIGGGEVMTPTSSSSVRTDAQLPPLLGVTPLGPVALSQEKIYQLKMLDVAFRHLPQPSDSEKVRWVVQQLENVQFHSPPSLSLPPGLTSREHLVRLHITTTSIHLLTWTHLNSFRDCP